MGQSFSLTVTLCDLSGKTADDVLAGLAHWKPRFPEGVASGDPDCNRVLFWTRYPSSGKPAQMTLEVAEDEAFEKVAASTGVNDSRRSRQATCERRGDRPTPGGRCSPTGRSDNECTALHASPERNRRNQD